MATIAKVAVWAFAIVIAVNQLGIATTLVNTLFIAVVGAVARGQQAAPHMALAANRVQFRVEDRPDGSPRETTRVSS